VVTNAHRILVVDDDVMICRLVGDILTRQGYETQTAGSAKEALEKIHAPGHLLPDLLVSDIMMPEMDGLELFETLRKDPKTRHIRVIFLTAKGDDKHRAKALMLGCFRFLQKPSSLKEISQSVSLCLTDAQQTQTLLEETDKVTQGTLGPNTVPSLIDAFIIGLWTGQLWVSDGAQEGKIEFANGRMQFARFGAREGADAIEAMLGLKEGSFRTLRD
jgi:CheY-like chemotaxis protein